MFNRINRYDIEGNDHVFEESTQSNPPIAAGENPSEKIKKILWWSAAENSIGAGRDFLPDREQRVSRRHD